jgi:hypothetical protein
MANAETLVNLADDLIRLNGIPVEIHLIADTDTVRLQEALQDGLAKTTQTDRITKDWAELMSKNWEKHESGERLMYCSNQTMEDLQEIVQASELAKKVDREVKRLTLPKKILAIALSSLLIGAAADTLYVDVGYVTTKVQTLVTNEKVNDEVQPVDAAAIGAIGLIAGGVIGSLGYAESELSLRHAKKRAQKEIKRRTSTK